MKRTIADIDEDADQSSDRTRRPKRFKLTINKKHSHSNQSTNPLNCMLSIYLMKSLHIFLVIEIKYGRRRDPVTVHRILFGVTTKPLFLVPCESLPEQRRNNSSAETTGTLGPGTLGPWSLGPLYGVAWALYMAYCAYLASLEL